MDNGTVKIRGKEYQTVAKRVADFRVNHPNWSITTELKKDEDNFVIIKAEIRNDNDVIIASGYAEEVRDSSNINRTSALENCETSAVGRALAFLGYGGSEIASANEVSNAIIAGAKKEVLDDFLSYLDVARDYAQSIGAIKDFLGRDDFDNASQEWFKLGEDVKTALWRAPSKGGLFTTEEREKMKTTEFRTAYYGESA